MARYRKSANGRYRATLTRTFPYKGFIYKPGEVTVREGLLKAMLDEEGLVANVVATA